MILTRGGRVVIRWAHNSDHEGSIPSPATSILRKQSRQPLLGDVNNVECVWQYLFPPQGRNPWSLSFMAKAYAKAVKPLVLAGLKTIRLVNAMTSSLRDEMGRLHVESQCRGATPAHFTRGWVIVRLFSVLQP